MDKSLLEELSTKLSTRQIAETLNASQTNVMYWLRKHGIKAFNSKSVLEEKKTTYNCLHCGKERQTGRNSFHKYCDTKCKVRFEHDQYIHRWKQGLESGSTSGNEVSNYVRRYLLDKYECACVKCGWNTKHPTDGKPLVEINHIDGNSANCTEENLEVLCPNCHSMTPTHGARNKVSARPKRVIMRD